MDYYLSIKRNEIGSFVDMWMGLESVIQSEVSQKEKNKYYILTPNCLLCQQFYPHCREEVKVKCLFHFKWHFPQTTQS